MVLVTNATEGVDADNISLHLQRLHVPPECHHGNTLVNPLGPQKGQWFTSLDMKDTYCHIGIQPADRWYLEASFLSQRHSMAIHSSAIQSLNQPKRIYKNNQTSTSLFLHAYVNDWLLNPGLRANILAQVLTHATQEQTSWQRSLCQRQ